MLAPEPSSQLGNAVRLVGLTAAAGLQRDTCAIPAQVGHVEKWQPALDVINKTRSWTWRSQVIADDGYGDIAAFRLGLDTRGLDSVVGVSTTTTAQPEDTWPSTPAYLGRGRPQVPARPESTQRVSRPTSLPRGPCSGGRNHGWAVVERVETPVLPFHGPAEQARRARDPQGNDRRRAPLSRLLAEWPDLDEPVRFWLSHLPATTPLPVLVRTAKLRWRIENDYRKVKALFQPSPTEVPEATPARIRTHPDSPVPCPCCGSPACEGPCQPVRAPPSARRAASHSGRCPRPRPLELLLLAPHHRSLQLLKTEKLSPFG
ncbi:hypothetical protein DLE01_25540 [Streptomyces sp. FT05W]|nr:transposase [Streptomyces sp. FT05W]PWS48843.1 hypothetical protein DLE01_25540 [Streptomyces sp. FT05W]